MGAAIGMIFSERRFGSGQDVAQKHMNGKVSASNILKKMRVKTKEYTDSQTKFRLPNGARFEAVYDALQEKWSVTLTIGKQEIAVVGSGIHWALRKAGNQWNNLNK